MHDNLARPATHTDVAACAGGSLGGVINPLERVRRAIGETVRSRVAGGDAEIRAERIWGAPGPRWHGPDDVIAHVNGDASMYSGGIAALLLQTLHPAAMAGVAGHSGYRSDPWGRLQRTAEFIAMTTFGRIDDAEALIERVKDIHLRVRGKTDLGEPYRASDPHLLEWVHVAETWSFLLSFRHFGFRRLTDEEADEYVAQAAPVGEMLGALDLPRTLADLERAMESYLPELRVSPAARDTVDFILKSPPIPWLARPGYWMLAAGAISLLPVWARRMLGLPTSVWFDRLVGFPLGKLSTNVLRWAMASVRRRPVHPGVGH